MRVRYVDAAVGAAISRHRIYRERYSSPICKRGVSLSLSLSRSPTGIWAAPVHSFDPFVRRLHDVLFLFLPPFFVFFSFLRFSRDFFWRRSWKSLLLDLNLLSMGLKLFGCNLIIVGVNVFTSNLFEVISLFEIILNSFYRVVNSQV